MNDPRPLSKDRAVVSGSPRARAKQASAARVAVLLALGAMALATAECGREPRAPRLSDEVLFDSLRAAVEAGRQDRVVLWAERRLALAPDSALRMIDLAMAMHDLAWQGAPRGRARTALRTSLDRIEMDVRAIALFDSAKRAASTSQERAMAGHARGMEFENYGLWVDALIEYVSTFRETGSDTMLAGRINHIVGLLRE